VEKILKAFYVRERNDTPPYTHNLNKLISLLSFFRDIDLIKIKIIENLNSYYLETRYTEEIDELNTMLTEEKANELISSTEELYIYG
jgi:HEPN domain-containing protein